MRKVRRALSLVLLLTLIIGILPPVKANAAVKLNQSTLEIEVGKTASLKVTGTKKTVKWSSSKKSVAAVSKKGVVTGKKAGSATITAKVSGKSYKCKVTVIEKFNPIKAAKKISFDYYEAPDYVYAVLKNNNSCDVYLGVSMVFYKDGQTVDTQSDINVAFEAGSECVFEFWTFGLDYDSYKMTVTPKEMVNTVSRQSKIKITDEDFNDVNLIVEITNESSTDLDEIKVHTLFFDANGECIGADQQNAKCTKAGSVDYLTINFPHDENLHKVIPDHYKIYVDSAYTYTL